MSLGFWQIVLLVVLFLLFFGRGKIPQLMGDIAEGIKSFKKGMNDANTNEGSVVTAEKTPIADADKK